MIDFLTTLSSYDRLPESAVDDTVDKLSFILQECIVQRLKQIRNVNDKFKVHHLACANMVSFFNNSELLKKFKLQKQTVFDLQLSEYDEDENHVTEKHKRSIRQMASLLLNRCANIQPSEIYSNSITLLRIMREDYVALSDRIDVLEEILQKLLGDHERGSFDSGLFPGMIFGSLGNTDA